MKPWGLLSLGLFILGCEDSKPMSRGKSVYLGNCTSCHNSDPKKDGSVGPAIFGSSEELLFKKLKTGEYPAGYKPKRQTRMMPKFEGMKDDDIREIRRYLSE
jgi:cytochrome c553